MKKTLILLAAGAIMLSSCSTTGSTAFSGAMFGSMIGSAFGGIAGGPRGSNIGTLIGAASGAVAGAAVGAAAERNERTYQVQRALAADESKGDYEGYASTQSDVIEMQQDTKTTTQKLNNGYQPDPVYKDEVVSLSVPAAEVESTDTAVVVKTAFPLVIRNLQFLNDAGTMHLDPGELAKVTFEIHNSSDATMNNVTPMVVEATGNKRIFVSPATIVENLPPHVAIRYTAFISAQSNLKNGKAKFQVTVLSNGTQVSDKMEFEVELK